jgi:flagellar protein FlgJ
MTAPINTNVYANDPAALSGLRNDARTQDPAALKQAAKQFESLFTHMLLKSMREANKTFGDPLFGSDQQEFYQDMFDDQMAVQLAQGKGLGLADMLVRQLQGVGGASKGDGPRAAGDSQSTEGLPLQKPLAAPLATSKADFVQKMLPHAQAAARELGVDPTMLVAQAALETGWGQSVPHTADGTPSYNFFGIKAGASWNGPSVNMPTLEFEEGIPVRRTERFRAYGSPADGFRDYANLIRGSSRYESALDSGSNAATFASALQDGGYATDPNYANKVVGVVRQVRELAAADSFKLAGGSPLSSEGV